MSCETTESIGAYLLGAVDDPEWTQIDHHLRLCEVCRSEIVRLAGLPGLLVRVPVDEVLGNDPLVAPVKPGATRRRASRRRISLLVAASVVSLSFLGFGGILESIFGG